MTVPPKTITVRCPQCQQLYIDWHIAALNPAQEMTTSCSRCGTRELLSRFTLKDDVLVVVGSACKAERE